MNLCIDVQLDLYNNKLEILFCYILYYDSAVLCVYVFAITIFAYKNDLLSVASYKLIFNWAELFFRS